MSEEDTLIDRLRKAGFSRAAIIAAWPSWWTEEAGTTPSGRAELRFALARRLGLEPKPLLGERVEFVWNDEARSTAEWLRAVPKTESSICFACL